MKLMLKSRLYTAVAASLVGLAAITVVPVQAQAQTGPNVSRANTGQALIYPYYTVNDGWITTFNVINTSDKTLAVKVRFHELKNSRDVLDFNIVLSPYDSWTGWVQDSTRGTQLRTVDNSCTSPEVVDGVNASPFAYTGAFDDTGGAGLNRLREGYVEVLLMGESESDAAPPSDWDEAAAVAAKNETLYVPYHAEHVDGVPRNCDLVDKAFRATAAAWQENTDPTAPIYNGNLPSDTLPGSGNPAARLDFDAPTGNWLKGNVGWLNAATGYGAGSEANAVENWFLGGDDSYVTAQQPPWFLEPTFATGGDLWTVTGVTPFESAVAASGTFNEWADNPNNGAVSDWVVTFPTKAYHVDLFNDQIQAASSKYRNSLSDVISCTDPEDRTSCTALNVPIPVAPFEYYFGEQGPDPEDGAGDSKITVIWDLFDREEDAAVIEISDDTIISPAPPQPIEVETLKYEANVIQFGDTSVLGATFPVNLANVTALVAGTSGWARLNFPAAFDGDSYLGLPVSAFAVRAITRTQDGQAYDSGYEFVTPERPTTPLR